jgi:hypothetical protein
VDGAPVCSLCSVSFFFSLFPLCASPFHYIVEAIMPPVAFKMRSASLANVPLLIVTISGLSRHVIDIVLSL